MGDLKESLKSKLKEAKIEMKASAEKAKLLESLQTDIASLKEDSSMAASLIEKSLKENTNMLIEHESLKEEVGKFGDILDKILELIMEFRENEGESEEMQEEVIEEEAVKGMTEEEDTSSKSPSEDKTMKEEIKEEIIEEIKEELKPEEEKVEDQPKPPVQMESGLKGVNSKKTLFESTITRKNRGEKSLAQLF